MEDLDERSRANTPEGTVFRRLEGLGHLHPQSSPYSSTCALRWNQFHIALGFRGHTEWRTGFDSVWIQQPIPGRKGLGTAWNTAKLSDVRKRLPGLDIIDGGVRELEELRGPSIDGLYVFGGVTAE